MFSSSSSSIINIIITTIIIITTNSSSAVPPKGRSEKGGPTNKSLEVNMLRPVRLLRVSISEGLTQANS